MPLGTSEHPREEENVKDKDQQEAPLSILPYPQRLEAQQPDQ